MIDGEKLKNYIKSEINLYGKPFEGSVYDFGLKLMDHIDAMENHTHATMDYTIVRCNVKENAEIIARILDCDVVDEEYFCIEPDGTLTVDLPIATEQVKRINLLDSNTHIGNLYYAD